MSVDGDPAPTEDSSSDPEAEASSGDAAPLSHEFVRTETHRLRRIAKELLPSDGDRDDLVQDVWLEALEHPPRARGRLSAWLRVVTNHAARRFWRRSRSREDRERIAARSEAEPSVLDALEREAAKAELLRWIEELHPPYREVLRLHFFENASPSEIARALDRRPATVRSQLKRGLEQLRARYDAGRGGALGAWPWLAALLAPAERARGLRRATILRTASISAGLLALTAGVLWFGRAPRDERLALGPPRVDRGSGASGSGDPAEVVANVPREDARRTATVPEAVPRSADGSAPVPSSEPGALPESALAGRTVDVLGAAVANAEVWLAPADESSEARVVARSDSTGRYSVAEVRGDAWIWSEEIDNGVSRRQLVREPGARETVLRDLVFEGNLGRMKGVVRDPRGAPVAGATVGCACVRRVRGTAGTGERTFERIAGTPSSSDAEGRFEITRIQVPSVHVLVIAPGEAPFAFLAEGKSKAPLEIVLPAAAELRGSILGPDGAPAAGVDVALEHPDPLPAARATTGADGSFRFEPVPPGPFTLTATGTGASSASWIERGELGPGDSRRIEPGRLSQAWSVRGVARAGEAPLEGWIVTLVEETANDSAARERRTRTAKDGTFAFAACAERSYAIALRAPGTSRGSKHAELRGVRPGGDPVAIGFEARTAPTSKLRGTLAEGNVPAGDAVVVVARPNSGSTEERSVVEALVDRSTGTFEIGPLAPGDYTVEARHPILGRLDLVRGVSLGAGASIDLGLLAPPRRGTLVVRWSQAWGTGAETFGLTLSGEHFFVSGRRQTPGKRMQFDEAAHEVRIADLLPGAYTLIVQGMSVATDLRTVRIEEDATRVVDVSLREGAPGEIRVTGERTLEPEESVVVTVHTSDGSFELPIREENRSDDLRALLRFRVTLPPGRNTIAIATAGGLRGERVFEAQGHVPIGTVEIPLR